MRTDTAEFSQYNKASAQEPAFVVEIAFDDAGTDLIYLTSHAITGLTGEIFESVLTDISGTTQKINPDKALSEIGSLSFSALDDQLTAKQRAKLNTGLGLRGKRARFYAGFRELDWSTYTLVQTQIIRGASYKDMEYSWSCSDIQRQMREQIFEVKQTALAATLEPDATEVEVFNTDGFLLVQQLPSLSGRTDAPGQKVGYIILEDDSQKEIIRYTGKTSTTFTGCTRGVLGTRPIRVEKGDDAGADNAPKVEEYVYLEMPAPMLAYAILTGSIYGEVGETLPDHWHLGIAPQFIRTSDYTNIGEDLWDLSNPDLGLPARFAGVTDEDGKQFIEEQLFLLMGCYAPIYSNGEIGLRRMTGVLSGASSIRTLDRRNIMKYGSLEHDMKAIINRIVISWNWVDQREEYTRTNLLIDQKSIDTHGDADLKQLEFRALHGSRHSYNTLRNRFDALRDRYAGPPLRISLDLMPDQNDLEVGDIVRLQLDEVEDYTGTVTGIDRSFEVQQVKVDWKTGVVSVSLFGSSQKAEPLAPEQEGATLPDAVYAVPGATEINGTNFPGAVSSSGGKTTITGDIDLAGADDLRDAAAIYYCLEDLTINGGVTVTISKNTQIRVKGFFQINGKIDGRGRGFPGSPRNLDERYNPVIPDQHYFGACESQMGAQYLQGNEFTADLIQVTGTFNRWESLSSGKYAASPELALDVQGDFLAGLPSDIAGQPGSHGQVSIFVPDLHVTVGVELAYGGAGGAGGAGALIISSGAEFGAGGLIDTSGGDGEDAASVFCDGYGNFDRTLFGGHGAGGMPGAVYWLVVGATSNPPTLTITTAIAETGGAFADDYSNVVTFGDGTRFFPFPDLPYGVYSAQNSTGRLPDLPNPLSFEDPFSSARYLLIQNLQSAAYKVQFINGEIEPSPDVPEFSAKPTAVIATEALNTPRSANANLSTLEVSVTAPADSAYSYALIEYRPVGVTAWTNAGPASPEALIVVASDGVTYEIRARSVSTSGVISEDYATTTIATTRIIGAEPADPAVEEKIVIPPVRGLELEGQGNETEFTGRNAKFVWRATTVSEWFEIGSEGQLGASAGELDLYFRDYQVEIWAQNQIVRTEWVKDSAFVYTHEKNAEDYQREMGAGGAWRDFQVRVYARGRLNQISRTPAKLAVSNPPPEPLTGINVIPGFRAITVSFIRPADLDFSGVEVWAGTATGFTRNAESLVYDGPDTEVVINGLDTNTTYFVALRPYDSFGKTETLSTEIEATTLKLVTTDLDQTVPEKVEGLAPTTGVFDGRLQSSSYIDLVWEIVDNVKVANYTLDINDGETQYTVAGNAFRLADVVPGDSYSFKVRANSFASVEGPFSDVKTISARVSNVEPAAISGATSTAGLEKVVLEWVNPASENFYTVNVHRSTTSGFIPAPSNKIASVSGSAGSVQRSVDAEVASNTTYFYKLVPETLGGVYGAVVDAGSATPFKITPVNIDAHIDDAAIVTSKIANQAIDLSGNKITGQLQTINLANAAVNTDKLANLSVEAAKLAGSSVTSTKIANLAVGSAAIASAAITNAKIANLAVDTAKITDAAITNAKIAALAVGSAEIQDAAIVTAKIGAAAIVSAKIGNAEIKTANIADLAVTNAKIDAIDAKKITTSTLDAARIGANTITSEKINVTSLDAVSADMGTLTAGKIRTSATTTRLELSTVNGLQAFAAGTQTLHLKTDGTGHIGASQDISWDGAGNVDISGVLGADSIFTNGQIVSSSSGVEVVVGPKDFGAEGVYLISGTDSDGNLVFGLDETGGALYTGAMSITGGSGLANLDDANADNITESSTKKWASESGATVGALPGQLSIVYDSDDPFTWPTGTNISGAHVEAFDSEQEGDAVIVLNATNADYSVFVALNGDTIGKIATSRIDSNIATIDSTDTIDGALQVTATFRFKASNLVKGSNSLQVWSESGDPGTINFTRVAYDPLGSALNADVTGENVARDVAYVDGTEARMVKDNAAAGSTFTSDDAGALAILDAVGDGQVTFNYALGSTKGGNAANTDRVGGSAASTVEDGAERARTGLDTSGDVQRVIQGSKLPSLTPPSAPGFFWDATYMGFHNGNGQASGWATYIKSDGQFHFGDIDAGQPSDNWIDYNGETLAIKVDTIVIDTAQFSLDAAGNAEFAGQLSAATGVLGDKPTGQFIEFDGNTLTIGDEVTIGDNTNRTVTVGAGGHFVTLNAALESLSRVVPAYKRGGFTANISILSGYVETEGINIVGLDLSWITITKSTGFIDFDVSAGANYFMKLDRGAKGPLIDASVRAIATSGGSAQSLFYIDNGSYLDFENNYPSADHTFDGANLLVLAIIDVRNGSTVIADNIKIEGLGTFFAVDCRTSSTIDFFNSVINYPNGGGLAVVSTSNVGCDNVTITCDNSAIYCVASNVSCADASITINGGNAFIVQDGGTISANRTTGAANVTRNTINSDGIVFG